MHLVVLSTRSATSEKTVSRLINGYDSAAPSLRKSQDQDDPRSSCLKIQSGSRSKLKDWTEWMNNVFV